MRNILVLRGGALGDFIVTLPALAMLRARWPSARIELVGNARAAELGRARGLLDAVHSQHEARWAALFGEATLPGEVAAQLVAFDLVVNYWPDPDGVLGQRFPIRAGQIYLPAPAMPGRAPAAAHYCAGLKPLGLETKNYFFPIAPVALRVSAGNVPPLTRRATIAIHPGSGSPRKNWPMERWLELIAELEAPVLLILGEAESERWIPIVEGHDSREPPLLGERTRLACSLRRLAGGGSKSLGETPKPARGTRALPEPSEPADHAIRLAVDLPLEELIRELNACRLYLGHDSGVSHLAAACGLPCVLLFGPTDPAMWAPPAPGVRVLRRGEDLAAIAVEEVLREVAALADRT
ncbi:MAG: glycosyltransferase family 9 protein [Opitutaceae bacterium]